MRTLYLDLVGGAAGDMILAALIDAGAAIEEVERAISAVVEGLHIHVEDGMSAGLRVKRLDVHVHDVQDHAHDHDEHDHVHDHAHPHRPYKVVRQILEKLSGKTRALAETAFRHLAEAEAEAHGVAIDDVEFHEVGSDDAIADIVGVSAAIGSLAVDRIVCSPIPLARGLTKGAHGPIPLPGPATLTLLKNVPIEGVPLQGETVTPTGAALIRTLATAFGPIPNMTLEQVGVGAGHREWPDRPNIVRALIGRATANVTASDEDAIVEANLDDMPPTQIPALKRALFAAGALDVWSTPIAMKKERQGVLVAALARRTLINTLTQAFFAHSTTLGVRVVSVARVRADRRIEEVATEYGRVRVKIADRPDGPPLVQPEHDDCARAAEEKGVPIRVVHEAALRAAWQKSSG
jgi:pyridinium-3,5-bisthiocarboxylic acid mononucleotide nickel chelatase